MASTISVYVGSGDWTNGTGRIDAYATGADGELQHRQRIEGGRLISFLRLDASQSRLYALDEVDGSVSAYAVDPETGSLQVLNTRSTQGHPVWLEVDRQRRYLLAANYTEGTVESFALEANGRVGEPLEYRATGAQAHSIVLDPAERHAFVPNKGADTVSGFRFDAASGRLDPTAPPVLALEGGPRVIAFHPSLPLACVINENASTLASYTYAGEAGQLRHVETYSTLPEGFSGTSTGGHVAFGLTGAHVYASNRSEDGGSLAIFAVSPEGRLRLQGHAPTGGLVPRHFALHPKRDLLLVGNQESESVATFRVDRASGQLERVRLQSLGVKPFCIAFRAPT